MLLVNRRRLAWKSESIFFEASETVGMVVKNKRSKVIK